jgi:transcriptional regulator with XRE-family HTH domain
VVKLKSRQALLEFAEFRGYSGRAIAKKARLSPAIVGHLMSGRRTTCNPATAAAIEQALGCPDGFLFEPSVSDGVLEAPPTTEPA